ncbi:MAG TPA: DivIVA domain-containing protein [Acidimicrobiales bacterium]|nr:DivIVA domain-containing protein [Acidimicrobiales bacterium]
MELTPQLLETQQFPEKWRGYDQDAVDDFLERVGVAVAELQERLRSANARLEALEASRGAAETPAAGAPAGLTAEEEAQQVGRALILAQQAADTALEEARAEAARLVADAESQARALTAEAAGESEQVRNSARAEADRILADARAEAEQTVTVAMEKAAAAEARLADADSHLAALEAEILAGARAEAERLTNEARDAAAVERHRATIKAEKAASAVKEANRAEIAELERAVAELRKRRASLVQDLESRTRELGGISEAIGDLLGRMSLVTTVVEEDAEPSDSLGGDVSTAGPLSAEAVSEAIDEHSAAATDEEADAGTGPAGESDRTPSADATAEEETPAGPGSAETGTDSAEREDGEQEADSDVVIDLTGSQPRVSGTGAPAGGEADDTPEDAPEGLPRWALVGDADQSGHPSRTANLQVVADNTEAPATVSATAVATEASTNSPAESSHLTIARDPGTVTDHEAPAPSAPVGEVSVAPVGDTEIEVPTTAEMVTEVVEEESITLEVLDPPSPKPATPPVAASPDDSSEAEAFWNEPTRAEPQVTEEAPTETTEGILEDPFLAALKGPESVEFDGRGRPGPDRPGRRRRRRR